MKLSSNWQRFVQIRQQYGVRIAMHQIIARLLRSVFRLQVIEVISLDETDLKDTPMYAPEIRFRFLTAAEVANFSCDPANELGPEFAGRIVSGNDCCMAALDGDRLAAYGWYARGSVEAEHNFGTAMSYPEHMVYMYKGFTHPDYRGLRLHGIGMSLALQKLSGSGVCSLISTVEWTNTASLRSCDKLGYRRLGRLWSVIGKGNRLCITPKAARQLGVRFGSTATVTPRPIGEPTIAVNGAVQQKSAGSFQHFDLNID